MPPCPTAGDLVLLADARLVGKPDFYGIDAFLLRDGLQTGGETFLKSSIAIGLRRARRELAKAHLAQFPAQGLRGQSDAEFRENPLAQIDEPPAHHAVNRRGGPSSIILATAARWVSSSFEGWPGAFLSMRPLGPMGVELHYPVPHDLQRHPADFRSLGAPRPVVDRGQSQ